MSIDASGNLVLVKNRLVPSWSSLRIPAPLLRASRARSSSTELEDTVWIKPAARGRLLVVDAKTNTIYSVKTKFTPGTIYTETPSDSGVSSFVGTVDLATGIIKPVIIGFGSATGLIFDPTTEDDD